MITANNRRGKMNFFNKPEKKTKRTVKTHRTKTIAEKREEWADKRAQELVKGDPIAEAKLLNNILKSEVISIPLPIDPIKAKKKKFEEKLIDMSLNKLEIDETIQEELTDDKMRELAMGGGGMARGGYGGDFEYEGRGHRGGGGGEDSFLSRLEEIEEVKKRLGGGGLSSLINADTINGVLTLVSTMMANKAGNASPQLGYQEQRMIAAPPTPPTKIYVVEMDGETVELDESAYRIYIQALKGEPKVEDKGGNGKVEGEKNNEPNPFDISAWSEFIEANEIDGFISMVTEAAKMGDSNAATLITTIQNNTIDEFLELLVPFAEQPDYTYVIKQLNSDKGKDWLKKVMATLKPKFPDKK
jgi:hypothetical protein